VIMRAWRQTPRTITAVCRIVVNLLLLSVAAAAASCALSTPPTRAETEIKALPPDAHVPSRWAPGSSPDAQVTNDWVTSFNDPGLENEGFWEVTALDQKPNTTAAED